MLEIFFFFFAILTSFINAVAGLGGGSLMLAVLAMVLPAGVIIPIHGIVQISANFGRAFIYRPYLHWPYIIVFGLGSLLAFVMITFILQKLDLQKMDWLLIPIGLYLALTAFRPQKLFEVSDQKGVFGLGVIFQFLIMIVGASGPVLMGLLPRARWERLGLLGTHGALMFCQHVLKVLAFLLAGFYLWPYVPLCTALIVGALLGNLLARRFSIDLDQELGRRIIYFALAFSGFWLFVKGVMAVW